MFTEIGRHRVCFVLPHFPVPHPCETNISPFEREALVASRCLPAARDIDRSSHRFERHRFEHSCLAR